MKNKELKSILSHRISEINDEQFLKALKIILDDRAEKELVRLTQEQLDDIKVSLKEIKQNACIENNLLEKEVRQWLNAR